MRTGEERESSTRFKGTCEKSHVISIFVQAMYYVG